MKKRTKKTSRYPKQSQIDMLQRKIIEKNLNANIREHLAFLCGRRVLIEHYGFTERDADNWLKLATDATKSGLINE